MTQRHAPRGPLKARDPIEPPHPMKTQCRATNRQGKRCGKSPIPGGTVCRMHGGAAPQVIASAQARLLKLQHPAIDALQELMAQREYPSTRYAAARDVLDRTIGKAAEAVNHSLSGEIVIKWEGE